MKILEDNDFTNKPVSDIYGAIIEGVEKLENLTNDFPKSILLLSEERNNSRIANSASSAISLAKEKDIAIYTIKYNRSGYHQFADPTLSKKTYGLSKVLGFSSGNFEGVNTRKSDEAKEFIISSLNNSVSRAKGMSYLVSLDLINNLKDGNEYTVSVNDGDECCLPEDQDCFDECFGTAAVQCCVGGGISACCASSNFSTITKLIEA